MRMLHVCGVSLLCMFLSCQGHAAAPVVDDSDNFAVFDDQGAPDAAPKSSHSASADEEPLAKEMPEDKSQSLSLSGQVRALQQEVQSLRGELEVQAHTLTELKQQQITFYKDVDARLQGVSSHPTKKPTSGSAVEIGAPEFAPSTSPEPIDPAIAPSSSAPVVSVPAVTPSRMNPADEQIAYLAAYDLVKAKHYNEALVAMDAFSKQYPHGGYTANAEYWMGELYLAKNMPAEAMTHFDRVLNQFPTSSKAAASALKKGYALAALGRREEAKMRLKDVIKNYPDTAAAQLAKTKLESL